MQLLKLKPRSLHVSHKSELLDLKKQLVALQNQVAEFDQFMKNTKESNVGCRKITIPTKGGLTFICVSDIIYCQAANNYTYIHTKNEKHLMSKPLKYVFDMLNSNTFIRCHQSYLINKNEIVKINCLKSMSLTLSNAENIPVSRRNKSTVLAKFQN